MPIISTQTAIAEVQKCDLSLLLPLRPVIIGPRANLHRYHHPREKIVLSLGKYDLNEQPITQEYEYPARTEGSIIDVPYVKIWLEDVLLVAFETMAKPSGTYSNKIIFDNDNTLAGHRAKLTANVNGQEEVFWTSISGQNGNDLYLRNDLPDSFANIESFKLETFIHMSSMKLDSAISNGYKNWIADQDKVTINDKLYTSSAQVYSATVYLEYREWINNLSGQLLPFYRYTDIISVLGSIDPDNPLAYAVWKAFQNTIAAVLPNRDTANNQATTDLIYAYVLDGIPDDPNKQPWKDALDILAGMSQVYNLVPLTQDLEVHKLINNHIEQQSDLRNNCPRAGIVSLGVQTTIPIAGVDTPIQAQLHPNPDNPKSSLIYLRLPNRDGQFITRNVQAGDMVRLYDAISRYKIYIVHKVLSEDALLLKNGPEELSKEPQTIEIWRALTKDQLVEQLIQQVSTIRSKRIVCVWPDMVAIGGTAIPGYFACAALSGLIGSIPPHFALTNVQLQGFDFVAPTVQFTMTQLNRLSAEGIIILMPGSNGTLQIKKGVTTDTSSALNNEEMPRRLGDAITSYLKQDWSDRSTRGPQNIANQFLMNVSTLKATNNIEPTGPPIYDGRLMNLQKHPESNKLYAQIEFSGPFPANQMLEIAFFV